jgi:hypothetical protein
MNQTDADIPILKQAKAAYARAKIGKKRYKPCPSCLDAFRQLLQTGHYTQNRVTCEIDITSTNEQIVILRKTFSQPFVGTTLQKVSQRDKPRGQNLRCKDSHHLCAPQETAQI